MAESFRLIPAILAETFARPLRTSVIRVRGGRVWCSRA
jgi:hypothetical protein